MLWFPIVSKPKTFLVAAAVSRGKIVCRNTHAHLLEAVLAKLEEAGAEIECGED